MIKTFELFAGIGAPRKALINLGVDVESLGYSEIDKYAIQSYAAMYNDTNNFGDITKIKELPQGIDILFHGSPCQDFSVAGKGLGAVEGTRSNLMFETVRLVAQALPNMVIWENVKGVLSPKHKPAFDKYLYEMEKLGYTNHYQVLNAKDYGIPQNRERIFVVSSRNNSIFRFPEKQKLTKCMGDFLDPTFGLENIMFDPKNKSKFRTFTWVNGENGADYKALPREKFDQNGRVHEKTRVCPTIATIQSSTPKTIDKIQVIANVDGLNFDNDKAIVDKQGLQKCQRSGNNTKHHVLDKISVVATVDDLNSTQRKRIMNQTGCLETLCGVGQGGNTEPKIIDKIDIAGNIDGINFGQRKQINSGNGIVPTLISGDFKLPKAVLDKVEKQKRLIKFGKGEWKELPERLQDLENGEHFVIRKLKPVECWRLMGFEDTDFEKASSVCSNSQLYKQAGNSIVVPVLEELFMQLFNQKILKEVK